MPKFGIPGLFSIGDDDEKKPAQAPVGKPAPVAAPVATPSTYVPVQSTVGADDDIKKVLQGALDKATPAGVFDYLKFVAAVEDQKANMPAESVRFQSVFSTAKIMGVSIDSLLQSADSYLAVLGKERDKYLEAEKQMTQDGVTANEQNLAQIDESIKGLSQKIQDITEQINKLQASRAPIETAIGENKFHIQQTNAKFMATVDFFVKKIESDKEKISKYVGKGTANG